jgi:hypothetical protein
MKTVVTNPLSMQRKMKAKAFLARNPQTRPMQVGPNEYEVASKSKPNIKHRVTLGAVPSCTCKDYMKRFEGKGSVQCKHIHEVLLLTGQEV